VCAAADLSWLLIEFKNKIKLEAWSNPAVIIAVALALLSTEPKAYIQ
jgi:hypothetical protein